MGRIFKLFIWFVVLLMLVPTAVGSAIGFSKGWPKNWRQASWESSGVLPAAKATSAAKVILLSSRTGQWKSIFAEHMSIVFKAQNAEAWTRYDVVGWGLPVRKDAYVADAYWYGNAPRIVYQLEGSQAEALIPKIEASIAAYPHHAKGSYKIWPGPNSNTFVSWVVRHTEGFNAELSPVAVGKDYLGTGFEMARAASGSGYTVSGYGLIGATLAVEEGLEIHLIGATIGIDPNDLAIKLPALGKLSLFDLF